MKEGRDFDAEDSLIDKQWLWSYYHVNIQTTINILVLEMFNTIATLSHLGGQGSIPSILRSNLDVVLVE